MNPLRRNLASFYHGGDARVGVGSRKRDYQEEQEDLAHIMKRSAPTPKPGVKRGGRMNAPFKQNNWKRDALRIDEHQ